MWALSTSEQKLAAQPERTRTPKAATAPSKIFVCFLFFKVLLSDCFERGKELFFYFRKQSRVISRPNGDDDVDRQVFGEPFVADGANLSLDFDAVNRAAVPFADRDSNAGDSLRPFRAIYIGVLAADAIVLVDDVGKLLVFSDAIDSFHRGVSRLISLFLWRGERQ